MTDDTTNADAGSSPVERGVRRPKFERGDLVRKRTGSQWIGRVVGEYSTALTPEGYAVESAMHSGSVQIYPAAALDLVARHEPPNAELTGRQRLHGADEA